VPNINEFLGAMPAKDNIENLQKIMGTKPCSKCDLDSEEYYWDPVNFIMTWTCKSGHLNTVKVNS
jgi:hypothetical protein